ncbi:MAG: flagellar hook-associated protein FlgK [Clostridiales bacterium]|jgi:flagellar hook-associated protein 1 FlgK|nr:flagellar hook-associated protein FlgK [Clostridiales bacterium]
MGMTSLAIAVSGLNAAQTGLQATGHNMANSETEGYTRQRSVQTDFFYSRTGENALGIFQKGLGTDIKGIVQLRDRFLDSAYRIENSRLGYYTAKAGAGNEIEAIIGETQSQNNFQSVILDLWNALNELSAHPEGMETRGNFISIAVSLVTKAADVYDRLFQYQHNLDEQIRVQVKEVNSLISRIDKLNREIARAEMSGDHANDYRDQRGVCLDKLSKILPIEYKENPDASVSVTSEGKTLLTGGYQNFIGLKYIAKEYSFVEPILSHRKDILPASTPMSEFEPLFLFNEPVNADYGNDNGSLKGLMISRGARPATYEGAAGLPPPNPADPTEVYRYNNDVYSLENCFIPRVMRDIDELVHGIATLINDNVAPADAAGVKDPAGPYDLNGAQSYTEVFRRKTMPRWNGSALIPETAGNYYTLYTTGNIEVNPALLQAGGGNLLALSPSGDRDDNRLILSLLGRWNGQLVDMNGERVSVNDGYNRLVAAVGAETAENLNFMNGQSVLTARTDEKRGLVMGVSLDEELKNMMVYQHAYGAAARVLNVIDSMLDRIINNMGA